MNFRTWGMGSGFRSGSRRASGSAPQQQASGGGTNPPPPGNPSDSGNGNLPPTHSDQESPRRAWKISFGWWYLFFTPQAAWTIVAILAFIGLYPLYEHSDWDYLWAVALGGIIVVLGLTTIPSTPPHFGILTVFGIPFPHIVSMGYRLLIGKPFIANVILIDASQKSKTMLFENIRSLIETPAPGSVAKKKVGGSVKVSVTVVWRASDNPSRAYEYVDAGLQEGVEEQLKNVVDESMHNTGNSMSWEDLSLSKLGLTASLYHKVTGIRIIVRNRAGVLQDITDNPFDDSIPEDAFATWTREVLMNGNGSVAIPGLGIDLFRINVAAVIPEGKLKEAAEEAAIERQQREAERVDIETQIELTRKMRDELGLSPEKATEAVQLRQGKITKDVSVQEYKLDTTGDPSGAAMIMAAIQSFGQSLGGKSEKKGKK